MNATIAPKARRRPTNRFFFGTYAMLLYAFLYLPLVVVVLYSFSSQKVNAWPIQSYSLDWYRVLRHDEEIFRAFKLSVRVGLIAAGIALVLGTLAALAIDRFDFRGKSLMRFCIVLPITLPGIVTGVAMLSYFTLVHIPLSNWTLIIGHATFGVTLVLNNVVARLSRLPRHLDEASADLGASPLQTFRRITLPLIFPAILAGAILAFTLSFDEVVVSFFLKGRDNTLPLLIWGRLRRGISPEVNAAATVIVAVSVLGVLISNRLLRRGAA